MKESSQINKKEKVGFLSSTSLVSGNMIGSGIFLLPASLAVFGAISLIGWIITTIGAIFLALVFARLSRIIRNPGGPYAYSREGFGSLAGFLVAWGYWVSVWCGNAAIAVAGTGYLESIIPGLNHSKAVSAIVAIAAIWFFTWVNTRRIRSIAFVQLFTTAVKIIPLVLMGSLGFIWFNPDYLKPFNLSGFSTSGAITATAALTLWAFLGMESATVPSDKVVNPSRTIPAATIVGTLLAAFIYISSTTAVMGIMDPGELQISTAPFSDAAGLIWGPAAELLFGIFAVIACFSTLNGWVLLQGQIPLAAATDRLFPPMFAQLSKLNAPVPGLLVSSVLASILVGINYTRGLIGMFEFIIKLSTLTVLLPYVLSSFSEAMIYLKKKTDYSMKRFTGSLLTGIPAFLYSSWAVAGLGLEVILWGLVLLTAGLPLYLLLIRKKKI